MNMHMELEDDHIDDHVDDEIAGCLNSKIPTSFFLYAGAGSGKTRSVVTAMRSLRDSSGKRRREESKKIGVISFTNAACDEISSRLSFDPLFEVATIHSFAWRLIGTFSNDIREWLRTNLAADIEELQEKQKKGRAGTGAANQRAADIANKTERLRELDDIRRFKYDPAGDNTTKDSLSHGEVIKIASDFISNKPLMQQILVNRYPVLLIDESQDTHKAVMEALLALERDHDKFALGLFGDTMQRIYGDGMPNLGNDLPERWRKPQKAMNHRSGVRIIKLANKIRALVDQQSQLSRKDRPEGVIRVFVCPDDFPDKPAFEKAAARKMAEITGQDNWLRENGYKTLTLEHHMSADRMGFLDIFAPLDRVAKLRTGLRDGSLPGIRFFSTQILPLVKSMQDDDAFAAMGILKKHSPLLSKQVLRGSNDQLGQLDKARTATKDLSKLCSSEKAVRLIDVLKEVSKSEIFTIPDSLVPFVADLKTLGPDGTEEEEELDDVYAAWSEFLEAPFEQVEPYFQYVNDEAPFGTHQGVKGLEFPRVMVVIDDSSSRGFMFSYEKLFGIRDKTATDIKHESEGRETGIDRTRRLFYVICTRAQDSLAIIAYTANSEKLKINLLRDEWFTEEEIIES